MQKSKHILTIYQMRGGRKQFAKRVLNQTIKRAGQKVNAIDPKDYARTLNYVMASIGMIEAYKPAKKKSASNNS